MNREASPHVPDVDYFRLVPNLDPFFMLSSLLYIIPLCVLWTARAAPEWASCSEKDPNIECTSVTVPLDHKNVDDSRTVNIAVTRYKATDNSSQ